MMVKTVDQSDHEQQNQMLQTMEEVLAAQLAETLKHHDQAGSLAQDLAASWMTAVAVRSSSNPVNYFAEPD